MGLLVVASGRPGAVRATCGQFDMEDLLARSNLTTVGKTVVGYGCSTTPTASVLPSSSAGQVSPEWPYVVLVHLPHAQCPCHAPIVPAQNQGLVPAAWTSSPRLARRRDQCGLWGDTQTSFRHAFSHHGRCSTASNRVGEGQVVISRDQVINIQYCHLIFHI